MAHSHDVSSHASLAAEVIARVAAFPMDRIVARHIKDDGVTAEQAAEHERELRRYLTICAMHPREQFPMFREVDGLWHAFVLHTRLYREFCHSAIGRFLDHAPSDGSESLEAVSASYKRFRAHYREYFGEDAPERFWPASAGGCGSTCSDCYEKPAPQSCTSCWNEGPKPHSCSSDTPAEDPTPTCGSSCWNG